jgi:hypothetical protein
MLQANARQGKNRRKSVDYMGVNEHFEPIFKGLIKIGIFIFTNA